MEIRPANRSAIEAHALSPLITLLEGDSAAESTVAEARRLVDDAKSVLVILDSDHSKAHVLRELEAYHSLVSPGSYIVATDGIMGELHDVPTGTPGWRDDNPAAAAADFARDHPEFVLEQPPWPFNESSLREHHALARRVPPSGDLSRARVTDGVARPGAARGRRRRGARAHGLRSPSARSDQ